jgi:hypothetical protein
MARNEMTSLAPSAMRLAVTKTCVVDRDALSSTANLDGVSNEGLTPSARDTVGT